MPKCFSCIKLRFALALQSRTALSVELCFLISYLVKDMGNNVSFDSNAVGCLNLL